VLCSITAEQSGLQIRIWSAVTSQEIEGLRIYTLEPDVKTEVKPYVTTP